MDEFQSEKEQIEELKKWWQDNGTFVVTGLVLGVVVLGGWKYWGSYKVQQAEKASALYEQLLQEAQSGSTESAAGLAASLADKFSSTPYSSQSALVMAQRYVKENQPEDAARELRRVIDSSSDKHLQEIARLRLARVQLMLEQPDEALATLGASGSDEFAAIYHDVRGDAYAQLGQHDAARQEYQSALDKFEPGLIDRQFVEMKLNDLGNPEPDA